MATDEPRVAMIPHGENANGANGDTAAPQAAARAVISKSLDRLLSKHTRTPELPDVNELLAGFAREFGGTAEIAHEWRRQLQAAAEARPGSKVVLDSFRDYARLLQYAKESQQPHFDHMDEAELRDFVVRTVLEHVDDACD